MSLNNRDSLRQQIIEAMTHRLGANLAESVFTLDLWPILEAAMQAGELLVARKTIEQKPIADGIIIWLMQCLSTIEVIKAGEAQISRRRALDTLYQLAVSAEQAVSDAKAVEAQNAQSNKSSLFIEQNQRRH